VRNFWSVDGSPLAGLPAYRRCYLRLAAAAAILAGAFGISVLTDAQAQEILRLPIATDFDPFDPDNASGLPLPLALASRSLDGEKF
jgi:hypothetical protein